MLFQHRVEIIKHTVVIYPEGVLHLLQRHRVEDLVVDDAQVDSASLLHQLGRRDNLIRLRPSFERLVKGTLLIYLPRIPESLRASGVRRRPSLPCTADGSVTGMSSCLRRSTSMAFF